MQNKSVNWTGVLLLLGVCAALAGGWLYKTSQGHASEHGRRTFAIELPADKFAKLERPAVLFDHEKHTEALKDAPCTECHRQDKDSGALVFGVIDPEKHTTRKAITDAYHDNCIGCHKERGAGPMACGECHVRNAPASAPWHSMELSLEQHQKHVAAMEDKCEACHHDYDEQAKKLVYKQGAETSCRDCHREAAQDNRPSMRMAAHTQCITCHMDREKQNAATGPVQCQGCHDEALKLPALMDMSRVKRLDRNQEDMPLITVKDNKMKPVPFDHKNHETVARNCRTCHHESLKACSECHTVQGKKEGGYVRLSEAFHRATSERSCVGCHEQVKKQTACRVCHESMASGPVESSCDTCHSGEEGAPAAARADRDPNEVIDWALMYVQDFPEDIEVKTIADKYEAVPFPHLEIIKSMNKLLGGNRLANVFHGDRNVVCAGCHHHSPMNARPPACSRCHDAPFDARDLSRPGLKGAYHQQCVGCHRTMNIKNFRDCTVCHKDKDAAMPTLAAGKKQ